MRSPTLALLLVICASAAPRALEAAPPTDAEVAAAEEEQNRLLGEAKRGGSMAGVVAQAESRHFRSATPLTLFLLGRAQYHAGDEKKAERTLRDLVAQEPGFWQVHQRLAVLALKANDIPRARQHLDLAAARRPDDETVLRLSVELAARTKDYDTALRGIEKLLTRTPDSLELKMHRAELRMMKGDAAGAYADLRALRMVLGKDVRVRYAYATAAAQTQRLDEAAAELEDLARLDPSGVHYLDLLRRVYIEKKDWPRVAGTLERLLPFEKEPQRAEMQKAIGALRGGWVPGAEKPLPTPQVTTVADLVNRVQSPNVDVRRKALEDLLAAQPPSIHGSVIARYHPSEEPDETCRALVLRLATAMQLEATTRVAGNALSDPSSLVRRVAAESLGQMARPAGVLYLVLYLDHMELGPQAPEDRVVEYNAGRATLASLARHDDRPVGEPTWVAADGLSQSWAHWLAWLDGPDGVELKLRAIDDLARVGESRPEFLLLLRVLDRNPKVVRTAHEALVAHFKKPSADPVVQRLGPTLPALTEADLKPEGREGLKARMLAWWSTWLAERDRTKQG
jgi:tetratricopeptide (TPR) repeat protein